ncbi:MAG: sulfotransferase [Solirubrobacterales bacterium]|jgi:hypothetical protein|nr:sulfotransferase [Solirubrobacterales bacterium]
MTVSVGPSTPSEKPAGSTGAAEGEAANDHGARVATPPSPGRVPDFFIVGHEKCGTTALYEMLRRHPQVFMPDIKEPRFFAPELRSRFRRLGPGELPETLEDYLSLFAAASPQQRVGEASPLYLRSHAAAGRIAEAQPAARIIAILREPASFLRSFHLQAVHNHVETQKDFAKAIALEEPRRRGKRVPPFSSAPQSLMYSDHVRYVEQLSRYHAVFAPEQVLVLIYEDFRRDNQATLRQVLRFLEVEEKGELAAIETEPLKDVRSLRLLQLGLAVSVARRQAAAVHPLLKRLEARTPTPMQKDALRSLWERAVYRDPGPRDEAYLVELRRRLKPEVTALSDYLGRDLVTLWGYGDIG